MIDQHSQPWWTMRDQDKMSERILGLIKASETQRVQHVDTHYLLSWLYYRDKLLAKYGSYYDAAQILPQGARSSLGWLLRDEGVRFPSPNIVKSAVDTVKAWLFSTHPLVGVDSSGVPFEHRFQVQEYEGGLDGLFNTPPSEAAMERAAMDQSLSGTGYAWARISRGEIRIERLHPWQVIFDYHDARHGEPTTVHVVEYRDQAAAAAWVRSWSNLEGAEKTARDIENLIPIAASPGMGQDPIRGTYTLYDLEMIANDTPSAAQRLCIVHSFRTATDKETENGRHVVAVYDARGKHVIAMDRPTSKPTLPVVWFSGQPDDEGIEGIGFGHVMRTWQEGIDYAYWKVQKLQRDHGWPKLPLNDAMLGQAKAWNKRDASVLRVPDDTPREVFAAGFLHPSPVDEFDIVWADRMMEQSQRIEGINAMMAQGGTRLGANASGQALQEEHYRSLDRFTPLVNSYARFRLRLAEECLHLMDDVLALNPSYAARYQWAGRTRSSSWAKLQGNYRRWNVSLELRGEDALSRASRTARLQEWAAQGTIDSESAKDGLLNTPDLRTIARLNSAGYYYVLWQVRGLLESDKDEDVGAYMPDNATPRALALQLIERFIQLARIDAAKPATLERLWEYHHQVRSLLEQEQAEQAQVALAQTPMVG